MLARFFAKPKPSPEVDIIKIQQRHTFQNIKLWARDQPLYEQRFHSQHPLYSTIFPFIERTDLQKYITLPDESITGLCLKFDMTQGAIRELNPHIGDFLVPQTTIQVPRNKLQHIEQPRSPMKQLHSSKEVKKFEILYCAGPMGQIRGTLTLNSNLLMFSPHLEDKNNQVYIGNERLLRFNSIIEMEDVQACNLVTVVSDATVLGRRLGIELRLRGIGSRIRSLSSKNREQLRRVSTKGKGIAFIHLYVYEFNEDKEQEESILVQKQCNLKKYICEVISQNLEDEYDIERKSITFLPFFQLITAKTQKTQTVWEALHFKPHLKYQSVLLPYQQFLGLLQTVPDMLKMNDWELIYSTQRDGTNFNTLLRLSAEHQPLLLCIGTEDKDVIGAYLTDKLFYSGSTIFGRGEMFLFHVVEGKVKAYTWTMQNRFFTTLDQKGLAIGMGENYGIHLSKSLRKGFSYPTHTFNSPQLTKKQEFGVRIVQVWGPCLE